MKINELVDLEVHMGSWAYDLFKNPTLINQDKIHQLLDLFFIVKTLFCFFLKKQKKSFMHKTLFYA